MSEEIPMMIAVRGFAVPINNEAKQPAPMLPGITLRKALSKPSDETLIFDCETTTDHKQNLRIGTYQLRKQNKLKESGVFYEPANLKSKEIKLLIAYAAERGLVLRTREDFVREVFLLYAWRYGATVVGFNLSFDLSHIAIAASTSHGWDMRGGFSLTLVEDEAKPRLLVKHLNSKAAFIRFAQPAVANDVRSMRKKGFRTKGRTGFFVDIKTLGAALTGGSPSLASLADLLGTTHRKSDAGGHGGPLTAQYLDYAVNDTQVTWKCYEKLQGQYRAHGLTETPAHRIYSEASLGKAYLRQMGVTPWRKAQPDFPDQLIGTIMTTYFGGRSEVRIRKDITRVLYCDFRSMYPTVCTNMGLWDFVIAQGIEWVECGEQVAALLEKVTLADLKMREFWKGLTALVQVQPDGDIFPVRAAYGGTSRTIGLNYLSSHEPLWFTLADCIASKLLTGKSPKVIRATKFMAKAPQPGLRPIKLGGTLEIDPDIADFYKLIIDERGRAQQKAIEAKSRGSFDEMELYEAHSQMLKLLANSTSYGIFAELNTQSHERPRDVKCHGAEAEPYETSTKTVEEGGTHFHPLIATLITGAARLMLAIVEKVSNDQGLGWAFCDTDSMALARSKMMTDQEFLARAEKVTSWFNSLNPYEGETPLFKVEKENFSLTSDGVDKHEPLYALAISAKRYVLFNLDAAGRPIIRKAMAHGLGHLRPPYKDGESPDSIPAPTFNLHKEKLDRWQYDLWFRIVVAQLEGHPSVFDTSDLPNLDKPAVSRYSAATPSLLKWFRKLNDGKDYSDSVKPFNFMYAYHVSKTALGTAIANGTVNSELLDGLPAVVAPFDETAAKAVLKAFDRNTGRHISLTILQTYRMAIAQYHLHDEAKFENGEHDDQGLTRRRHVRVIGVEYIGKEANRWEEQFYLGELPEAQIEYGTSAGGKHRFVEYAAKAANEFGKSALAEEARLSRQQLHTILGSTAAPRDTTIRRLLLAIAKLRQKGATVEPGQP